MHKQNIYLLERENFAPMQIFALLQGVANYLNDASSYIYLMESDVFLSVPKVSCAIGTKLLEHYCLRSKFSFFFAQLQIYYNKS